jgi:hypothetical protein
VLSVVGLSEKSPPSSATGPTYYGLPSTTATYGAARAYALGAIIFDEFDSAYAAVLKDAAIKAWTWAEANPDVKFSNNSSSNNTQGLAAGNQEIGDDGTGARTENRLHAALYIYELTGDASYLKIFDDNYKKFPIYDWWGHMDQYRTGQHLLYLRYMSYPDATPKVVADLKNDSRGGMIGAFNKSGDFAGKLGTDGYRSFIRDYNWGSNNYKAQYGLTFWLFAEHDLQPAKNEQYMTAAEDYLHYIHGVNPFNHVYLTNMNGYGASKSLTSIYHTWFWQGTKWSENPAPGYLSGGANENFNVQSGFPNSLGGYKPNAAELELGNYILENIAGSPPVKSYMDINHSWPINSWEITEPMGAYQVSYIRLLSKFAAAGNGG